MSCPAPPPSPCRWRACSIRTTIARLGTKLLQTLRALQLELRYSKDEILSIYLTLAPFGGNIEGVRAASLAYFGKEPKALTLAEAALLVALPQSPERERPDRHPRRGCRRARQGAGPAWRNAGRCPPTKRPRRAPRRVPPLRLPMPMIAPRLAERLHRARSHDHIITTTIDGRIQRAVENMALTEAVYFDDRRQPGHRRRRYRDARGRSPRSAAPITGARRATSIWPRGRARPVRRSSPSSTASPSTIWRCIPPP